MTAYSAEYNDSADEQMRFDIDGQSMSVIDPGIHVQFSFDVLSEHGIHVVFSFKTDQPAEQIERKNINTQRKFPVNHKKRNKIINSTYRSGENLKGDDYKFDTELRVDPGY